MKYLYVIHTAEAGTVHHTMRLVHLVLLALSSQPNWHASRYLSDLKGYRVIEAMRKEPYVWIDSVYVTIGSLRMA